MDLEIQCFEPNFRKRGLLRAQNNLYLQQRWVTSDRITDPSGAHYKTFLFDRENNLVQLTTPDNSTVRWEYDNWGWKKSYYISTRKEMSSGEILTIWGIQ